MRHATIPAMIALVVALAGCGSSASTTTLTPVSSASTTTVSPASPSGTVRYVMPASSSPTSCSVYLSGHDAQITASSDNFNVAPFCRATIQAQAASGLLWNNYPPSPMPTDLSPVCELKYGSDSGTTITVLDDGGQVYGQQECAALLAQGWTEQAPTQSPSTTSPPTDTSATTTSAPPKPPEIVCPTDANTGAVLSTGCFWAVPPSGPYNGTPAKPTAGAHDSQSGCIWRDNGSAGVNSAGPGYADYTCQ